MLKATLIASLGLGAVLLAAPLLAQSPPAAPGGGPRMEHEMHGQVHRHHVAAGAADTPSLPGQDAFGAIAEVVGLLEADPGTDWSRVDLEKLRQHLIDMNEVVLRAAVKSSPVPDGLAMEVTGTGRTEQAIHAMLGPHATELDRMPAWRATTERIPGGLRLTVTARRSGDDKTVAMIRGLGFAGLLVQGGHHGPHHLAIATGELPAGHSH
jgi:hypothetical protein